MLCCCIAAGVKFHDGASWNCAAAKLNFDHVFAPPLTTSDWHGWYDLPKQAKSWKCTGTYTFVLETKGTYYPLLQELSYIRPLRMLSPTMFVSAQRSTWPVTQQHKTKLRRVVIGSLRLTLTPS